MGKSEGIVRGRTRKNLEQAYSDYLAGKEGAETALFQHVAKFAKSKISNRVYGMGEGVNAVDDQAQEVAITVWQQLPTLRKGVESFYPWLHKICFNKGIDTFKEYKAEGETKVPLMIESEDEPGEFEDNPEIYNRPHYPQKFRVLPEWFSQEDRLICAFIRDSMSYAEIGKIFGITENAVGLKIKKLRQRVKEKAQSKTD
jgi:RNA polymerase sigma factor (sigma-70 family)